jgi:MoaA/NifB/PqqE/SkfB family radical SAM enzyme
MKDEYGFQNIYVIATYKCNWECPFCLFRYNTEQDASEDLVVDRVKYAIHDSKKMCYVKITGGEPLLKQGLLGKLFDLCNKERGKIYKIGVGSNGSIPIGGPFEKLTVRTHVFFSRHSIEDSLPKYRDIVRCGNDFIDYRLNCNLIKGGVDSVDAIEKYIDRRASEGFRYICFRELSAVDLVNNSIYPKEVVDYDAYYHDKLVRVSDILKDLEKTGRFEKSKVSGNYYDTNIFYWYRLPGHPLDVSVKFRIIDERRLLEYNRANDGVDEYVVHPDGTLTGCWDKDMKVILKGGDCHAKQTVRPQA